MTRRNTFAALAGAGAAAYFIPAWNETVDGDKTVVASVAGVSSQATALIKVSASAKLSMQAAAPGLLARVRGANAAKRGWPPAARYAGADVERLMYWLG